MDDGRGSNSCFSSPARYPKDRSYKPLVEEYRKLVENSGRSSTSKSSASSELTRLGSPSALLPGDSCEEYRLSDGGRLKIVRRRDGQINYYLKLEDGRQVFLERRKDSIGLLVADADGNTLKFLESEL